MRNSTVEIDTWTVAGTTLERYRYGPGPAMETARHAHPDYQLCLSVDTPGEYHYRGARHFIPTGAVSAVYPGEQHAARDLSARARPSEFWVLMVPVEGVQPWAPAEECSLGLPFLPSPVLPDHRFAREVAALPRRFLRATSALEQETLITDIIGGLAAVSGSSRRGKKFSHGRVVREVRDRLAENLSENLSLAELARAAGLSPWQLCRAFRTTYGLAPHAWLTHRRIEAGKRLLSLGWTPSAVAFEVGFADQSHFHRHFRRLVGASPGQYGVARARTFKTARARTDTVSLRQRGVD